MVLLSFRIANYRSFKDEQEFSFVRSRSTQHDEAATLREDSSWRSDVGTVAGLYGANASGKSNLLKALVFMKNAVQNSHRGWAPDKGTPSEPFRLDSRYEDEPSLFEVVIFVNRVRYQYGFRLTKQEVVGEWLYAYPNNRRQIYFERDISAKIPYYFGKSFKGRNHVIAELTRPNSLFLSAAFENNHNAVQPVNHWFSRRLMAVTPEDRPGRAFLTADMAEHPERWREIIKLMKSADLGITEGRVLRDEGDNGFRNKMLEALKIFTDRDVSNDPVILKSLESSSKKIEFAHSVGSGQETVYLPLVEESLGTQVWFALIGPALDALANSATLLVDELDASLHPHLTAEILTLFRDPEKNKKQAQILFSTHDTTLLSTILGDRDLHRDQVWFTEKRPTGDTVLYPLTDFSPRKSENLERGYLQGRYGAVPFINKLMMADIAKKITSDDGDHRDESVENHG